MPTDQWGEGTWGDPTEEWGQDVAETPETPPAAETPIAPAGASFAPYPAAPLRPFYRVLIGNLLEGGWREELPLESGWSYSFLLNRPGAFDGSIVASDFRATKEYLDPASTAIYVERDGAIMWGGILWSVTPDADRVRLAGEGFWSHFRHLHHLGVPRNNALRYQRWNNVDIVDLIADLLRYAQGTGDYGAGLAHKSDTNIQVDFEAEASPGTLVQHTLYRQDNNVIAEVVEGLAEGREEGQQPFLFSVDVEWAGDEIRKVFRLRTTGSDNQLVFEDGRNCTIAREVDGTTFARKIIALGAGEGAAQLQWVAEDLSDSLRPGYERIEDYPEITRIDPLRYAAASELRKSLSPSDSLTAELMPNQKDLTIGSWKVGDYARCRQVRPYETVDGYRQVIGTEVTVSEQEKITVDFGTPDA